jgi:predicted lipid-binding transport protein (Tim44 family)
MRKLTALAALLILLAASPAFAQRGNNAQFGDEFSSENQVDQYGQFFAIVLAGVGTLVVVIATYLVVKGMRAEASRGKTTSQFREEILDKMPKKAPKALFMGERVPEWKTDNRLKATKAALKFLARADDWFKQKELTKVATVAFQKIKMYLEERSAKKIAPRVTAECLEVIQKELRKLREEGKLRYFGPLEVAGVEIVHFEAPQARKNHTFTALITAISKDYYKDEKTGQLLRGDKKTYTYQEFWTFRRFKERWLVERIRPADDMDRILGEKLVMTQDDLDEFSKDADPELLREFVGR